MTDELKKLEFMTEPELCDLMNMLARGIEMIAGRMGVEKPHFVLLVFNDPALAQYVSNCERTGVIESLEETAGRLRRKEDVPR